MATASEKIMSALLLAGIAAWGYQSFIVKPERRQQRYPL